jgi:hypothetical protein
MRFSAIVDLRADLNNAKVRSVFASQLDSPGTSKPAPDFGFTNSSAYRKFHNCEIGEAHITTGGHMKVVVEHILAFLVSFLSSLRRGYSGVLLWWELRNNHGKVAIMLIYSPELEKHAAAERGFTKVQRKFEARSQAKFMRFVFEYNQPFCKRLGVDAADLPVVVCEWSRLVNAIERTTTRTSAPISATDEKILEHRISEFLGISAELAKCRPD